MWVLFKCTSASHLPHEIIHCHYGNQIVAGCFTHTQHCASFIFFIFFFMLLGIAPRPVPFISKHVFCSQECELRLIYEFLNKHNFFSISVSLWLRIELPEPRLLNKALLLTYTPISFYSFTFCIFFFSLPFQSLACLQAARTTHFH